MPKTNTKTKKATTTKKKVTAGKPKKAAVKKAAPAAPKKAAVKKATPAAAKKATTKKAAPKKTAATKTGKAKQPMSKTTKTTKAARPKKAAVKKAAPAAPKKAKKAAAPRGRGKGAGKASFKKEITQKLLEAKGRILHEVSHMVKSESSALKPETGDIYDIASNERERELTLLLGDRDREKLAEIERALERIQEDVYGTCEECGEPIAENRLRILPSARVCIECQSRNERVLKITGGRFEEERGLGILERGESEDEEF
ncbi:MAG: TraR/DksA family transcriptional regulator [Thermodesulfobacteriota bacterium]